MSFGRSQAPAELFRRRSMGQQIAYAPGSMTCSFGRDFSLDGDEIGLTTLEGRKKDRCFRYPHMEQHLDGSWKFGASKLVKHQDGAYSFHLCCERETENSRGHEVIDRHGSGCRPELPCGCLDDRQEMSVFLWRKSQRSPNGLCDHAETVAVEGHPVGNKDAETSLWPGETADD
ncbi:MAG: putative transposase, partial [Methanofollis sp.]|nr:putative transposase [Methanofollis sp.]